MYEATVKAREADMSHEVVLDEIYERIETVKNNGDFFAEIGDVLKKHFIDCSSYSYDKVLDALEKNGYSSRSFSGDIVFWNDPKEVTNE